MSIPSLELLKNAPPSPHKTKGEKIEGFIFKNEDGMWLEQRIFEPDRADQIYPYKHKYIWISSSDMVTKL